MCATSTLAKADIFLPVVDNLETFFSKKDPHFG